MKKHLFFCLSLFLLLTACGKSDDVEQTATPTTPELPTNPDTPGTPGEDPDVPGTPDENPDNPDLPSTPGGELNGHEYVDLGLPSGTLWATCNVGASSPADYGDYFVWGETVPKTSDNLSTYKWSYWSESAVHYVIYTKYNTKSDYGVVDNKIVLEAADDAATVNWGSGWRMPTSAEIRELCREENCTWTWTTRTNSKAEVAIGYEVKSKTNGNSIFLPAAGIWDGSSTTPFNTDRGYYLGASLDTGYPCFAWCLNFRSTKHDCDVEDRDAGQSVRPVHTKPQN